MPNSIRDYCKLLNFRKGVSFLANSSLRSKILKELETDFLNLISSAEDVERLFEVLLDEEKTRFYTQFKKEIFAVVFTVQDVATLWWGLSQEQVEELYCHVQQKESFVIETFDEYCRLLHYLKNPDLRAGIFKRLKTVFPTLIKSEEEVKTLLQYLKIEEFRPFQDQFKDELFAIFKRPLTIRFISINETRFEYNIGLLQQKMSDFYGNPKLRNAYDAACILHEALKAEGERYFSGEQSAASYQIFKEHCEQHIKTARNILDEHRGWAKILLNILGIIGSGGVGYVIAACINIAVKGKFTFFSTDSSEKMDTIEGCIGQIAPAA
jgi:hypothetical protein